MEHTGCERGILPVDFCSCATAGRNLANNTLSYVKFETTEVETYGKGKTYTRIEKVETELTLEEFVAQFRSEFASYAQHIVAAWFLRSTKQELIHPKKKRPSVLTIVSDFGETFLVVGKHETSDQYFKRPEVNLHASVCNFQVPKVDEGDGIEFKEHSFSYIVSSDTK